MTAEIPYRIRRSDRARRVRVTVEAGTGVEVVLPRRAPEREAARAMDELAPWVSRRLAQIERSQAELGLGEGFVPCLGQRLELIFEPGRTRATQRGERLLVPAGDWRPAAERWYRRRAREEIPPRLDAACAVAGTEWTTLSIRGQRTRWASCAPSGAMSFNWRLLMAPPAVLETVVWHEVCHLEIADHSRRFWALMDRRRPGHRDQQRWLRRHGPALVL